MNVRRAALLPLVSLALLAPATIPATSTAVGATTGTQTSGPQTSGPGARADAKAPFEFDVDDPYDDATVQGAEQRNLGPNVYDSADVVGSVGGNLKNGFFQVYMDIEAPHADEGYTTYAVDGAVKYVKGIKKVRRNSKTIKRKVYGFRDVHVETTLGAPKGEQGVVVTDGPALCGDAWMTGQVGLTIQVPVKCFGAKAVEGSFVLTTDAVDYSTGGHVTDRVDLGTVGLAYRHTNKDYPGVWNSFEGDDAWDDATVTGATRNKLGYNTIESGEIHNWAVRTNYETDSVTLRIRADEPPRANEQHARFFAVGTVTYVDRVETVTKENGETVRKTYYGTRPIYIGYTAADPAGDQGVIVQGGSDTCRGARVSTVSHGQYTFDIPTSCFGEKALYTKLKFGIEATDKATGGVVRDAAWPPLLNLT